MAQKTISMGEAVRMEALAKFGMSPEQVRGRRVRLTTLYDTQPIAAGAADVSVEFFNTALSSEAAHAEKVVGCNLKNVGVLADHRDILVLGYGIEFPNQLGGSDPSDAVEFFDNSVLSEVWVNNSLVDLNRRCNQMGMNRGLDIQLLGVPTVASDYDQITTGAPGAARMGHELQAFEWYFINGGAAIKAKVRYRGPTSLAAPLSVRFHLLCLLLEDRA